MGRIVAVAWDPPPAPELVGPYRVNQELARAELWPVPGIGPEDVGVAAEGTVYTGVEDGRILRFGADGGGPEVVADTGRRPLGIEVDHRGRIVICDAFRGLLRLDQRGTLETLVDTVGGEPLRHTNNASISSDGAIYFTDSSRRYGFDRWKLDIAEHSATGRLLVRRPDGSVETLLDGLNFANGVALSRDESFLVVVETGSYRLHKVWLVGDRSGHAEVFIDNLPGFPDNVSRSGGVFWLAIAAPRDPLVDFMAPRPWLRNALARFPYRLLPGPKRHGFVLGLDEGGAVVHNLQDPTGRVAVTTAATMHRGRLFIGSLRDGHLAVYPIS